ncbi:hypothetical protein [Thermosipho melanesiensis]|uniref:Uncharacterized protein n=1 Tax=Thermosipho melanesiensis (strain DSM 12029 / CIP 104789 / BI429) TaxID=391009 RepID=A6LP34_THEM4|nr:hypothetical protein [Thermosipho melanesiensis]ABR31685.1 hypothetical protein Tmel_1850 [Thermosipho melanesiensis BI429]
MIEYGGFERLPSLKLKYEDKLFINVYSFNFSKKDFFVYFKQLKNVAKSNVNEILIDLRYAYAITNDLSGLYTILSFVIKEKKTMFEKIIVKYGNQKYTYSNFGYLEPNNINFFGKNVYFIGESYDPIGALFFEKNVLYTRYKIFKLPWSGIKIYIPTAKYFLVK